MRYMASLNPQKTGRIVDTKLVLNSKNETYAAKFKY